MLIKSGDLWPVSASASRIPWTRRRAVIRNYLHVGRVTFETLVYDTNVGDIAPLSCFFNRRIFSVSDLNYRFGRPMRGAPQLVSFPDIKEGVNGASSPEESSAKVERIRATLCPKLVIFLGQSDTLSNPASSEGSVSPSEGELFLQRLQGVSKLFRLPRLSPTTSLEHNNLEEKEPNDALVFCFDELGGEDEKKPQLPRSHVPCNATCFEQMCNFEPLGDRQPDFDGSFLCDNNLVRSASHPRIQATQPPIFDWLHF